MSKLFTSFAKLIGYPSQHFYFKKKVYFENDDKSLKHLDGACLIVSNHVSVYDYPLMSYIFNKQLHCLVGEHIYKNKVLGLFIKHLGNIKVDREAKDFSFIDKAIKLLQKGEVCLAFPESRLHTENEDINTMLEFKPSFVYIALQAGVPIVPVYTNGIYGKKKKENNSRAKVIIGKKIYPATLVDKNKTDKQNIMAISDYVKQYILNLKKQLESKDHGK